MITIEAYIRNSAERRYTEEGKVKIKDQTRSCDESELLARISGALRMRRVLSFASNPQPSLWIPL